jgi:hypothetical protein
VRGRALALAVVVTAVVVVVVVVVTRSGSQGDSAGPVRARLPLAASAGAPAETSVLLPMGHLDDPANTFWELLVRPSGGSSWILRTPPGVADNGGLVAALPPVGPLVAGFLPSFDLTFSPLARSSDAGRSWSSGQLPQALAPVADGLAVAPEGSLLALVSGPAPTGRAVLSSSGSLSTWRPVVTTRTLDRARLGCGTATITAVAFDASGESQLGLACSTPGRIGVAELPRSGSGSPATVWAEVGPTLPASQGRATVIRLEGTGAGSTGLARVSTGTTTSLVAFWSRGTTPQWVESRALPVPAGWSVQATATGVEQSVTVLLASGRRRRVEQVDGPGRTWVALPAAPAGAGAVAATGGETDTFVSNGSRLAVWALPSGSASWVRTASLGVPIQYGSSS